MTKKKKAGGDKIKRKYLSQSDVPGLPLSQALRVPKSLNDNFAKAPTKPLRVAESLGLSPTSGYFRLLTGAAIGFGLTEGGANADSITLTELGKKIVSPTSENEDSIAQKNAFLKPRIIGDFLTRFNNNKLPPNQIALNILEEMGCPRHAAQKAYNLIIEGAEDLGLIRELKGQHYVDLDLESNDSTPSTETNLAGYDSEEETKESKPANQLTEPILNESKNRRVFITHGKNKGIVNQLKELLKFGGFEPKVAIEHETTSIPLPVKILEDMRSCYAAIIHVGAEKKLIDDDWNPEVILNQNVLIEIGVAMALYENRFILLVDKGVKLPSNLQGLYQVRFEGDKLDFEDTMKLLKAFNEFQT